MTDILHQSEDLLGLTQRPSEGILPLQASPSQPTVTGLDSATGMMLPDKTVQARLAHFPEELYDLTPGSHLVRLMKALLGESGVGQLRKRNLVAQMQGALTGSSFFDLDRFYGAIFRIGRRTDERLDLDPTVTPNTPDDWDDIASRDASFRERIMALAKSLPMAGTLPGIQTAAEAIIGCDVDVYETWDLMEGSDGSPSVGRTWADMETIYPTWAAAEADGSWLNVENAISMGRSGFTTRNEVIIRPKCRYDDNEEMGQRRVEDEYSLVRTLSVLKPAGVLLTVNSDGVAIHQEAAIAAIEADSNFWEVQPKVRPRAGLVTGTSSPYPDGLTAFGEAQALPRPPYSSTQGQAWSYAPQVVSVTGESWTTRPGHIVEEPVFVKRTNNATRAVATAANGKQTVFSADKAIIDPRKAIATRYSSDGVLVAAPYSGPRNPAVSPT